MAHIEWYSGNGRDPRTTLLASTLKLPQAHAVGLLVNLASWAIEHRPGAVIEQKLIALAAQWDGAHEDIISALSESGWLEPCPNTNHWRIPEKDWEFMTRMFRKSKTDAAKRAVRP